MRIHHISTIAAVVLIASCDQQHKEQSQKTDTTMNEQNSRQNMLDSLTASSEGRVWTSLPWTIGEFGYVSRIEIWTPGGPPSERQIDATVRIATSKREFRKQVAEAMRREYDEYIRPEYLKTVGDPTYSNGLTVEDLPELQSADEIWRLIDGMMVFIDEDGNLNLSFTPRFDRDHDFAVRFRDDEIYEVMLDG